MLACDFFITGFWWHSKAAAFYTDPFILGSPGEIHIQAIKIALNLIIIIKSPAGFPSLLSRDYITVWYLVGERELY